MPAFVRATNTFEQPTSSGLTVTVVIPPTAQVGDIALVQLTWLNASTISGPAGWDVPAATTAVNNISETVASKVLAAGDINASHDFVLGGAGQRIEAGLIVVGGAQAPATATAGSAATSDDSTIVGIPAVEVLDPDSLVVALAAVRYGTNGSGAVDPAGSGWTEAVDARTSNGSGAHAGTWIGHRTTSGNVGATSVTATGQTTVRSGSRVFVFEPTPVATLPFTAVTATGWTASGGTAAAVLADSSDTTTLVSPSNPAGSVTDKTMPPVEPPTGNLVVKFRARRANASSASVVVTLRDGATVVATATVTGAIGTEFSDVTATFAAANLSAVTAAKWRAGTLTVRAAWTAAA